MNDYLGKEYNEATTHLFSLLHTKLDLQKRLTFQILYSNINISKFGYQNERGMNGFLNLDSEDLDDPSKATNVGLESQGEPRTGDLDEEASGPEEESDSETEQMELNRLLKEGKSGAKGIQLGDESLEAHARVVMTRDDHIEEFEIEGDQALNENGHFESFENQKVQIARLSKDSNQVNPLFENREKTEGNSQTGNQVEHGNLFEVEPEIKITGQSPEIEKHEIKVEQGEQTNDFPLKLSFANDSFNHTQSGQVDSEKVKVQSSFEVEPKNIKKDIDYLLSSKTLGERSPKTSNMYQER